ncbi:HhH-GPD-type base excision DNA repair protein [Nocardia implantans]|uniref:HhH-GPD-type base excision DNA repair protein n=1 Tax=Nocardia implantans TaxID=3108168 RepID=A0ABU6ANV1_9NOCA|nr:MULTISPECIES: HhH-GPD-type base excision DNA repair protein [unclassified Nocardia]MBF6192285.1 Fe-S cluster assembly protein HesB [Nocardia beijingensis]MEA3531037.1 HhH-GPD-type base excision DNA repair protein [Nocardia sp. CDC192]MEB3509127.1 HhH-GPD-type base excision DNA repair protein [Nocardia sp. CDC186]
MTRTLCLAQDAEADRLLTEDHFATLLGMLLDQQYPMEHAFRGPKKIADRMGGFDIQRIAEADPQEFEELAATPPAIHRYGRSMARRAQELARYVIEHYDGKTENIWTAGDPDGKEVLRRLRELPGYGEQKAKIFLALLGKQRGVRPEGWRAAAGAYGDEGSRRSVADVTDAESLAQVREFKKQAKAAAKAK